MAAATTSELNAVVNKKSLWIKQFEAALDGDNERRTSDSTITELEAELRAVQKESMEKTARLKEAHKSFMRAKRWTWQRRK